MKNTYILLALLPLISMESAYSAQVNVQIQQPGPQIVGTMPGFAPAHQPAQLANPTAEIIIGAQPTHQGIHAAIASAYTAINADAGAQTTQGFKLQQLLPILYTHAQSGENEAAQALKLLSEIKQAISGAIHAEHKTMWSSILWYNGIDANQTVTDLKKHLTDVEDTISRVKEEKQRKFNKQLGKVLGNIGRETAKIAIITAIVAPLVYFNRNKIGNCLTFTSSAAANAGVQAAQGFADIAQSFDPQVVQALGIEFVGEAVPTSAPKVVAYTGMWTTFGIVGVSATLGGAAVVFRNQLRQAVNYTAKQTQQLLFNK